MLGSSQGQGSGCAAGSSEKLPVPCAPLLGSRAIKPVCCTHSKAKPATSACGPHVGCGQAYLAAATPAASPKRAINLGSFPLLNIPRGAWHV